MDLFLAAAFLSLLVTQLFFYPDFVKLYLLASFGYAPFAAVSLVWLWRKGVAGKVVLLAFLLLMSLAPLIYGVLRWWVALRDGLIVLP